MPDQITAATVPSWRAEVRVRAQRGKLLIALATQARELDPVGSLIWRNIDGTRSIADLATIVCASFDVDAKTAETDICDLVRDLARDRFIDTNGAAR